MQTDEPPMRKLKYLDVQSYCAQHSSAADEILHALDRETHLTTIAPQMSAGPHQGMLLQMLSQLTAPRRILEIGTFSGYASICLARGLAADGHLDTIEVDPERATMIRKYLKLADIDERVTLHVGDAFDLIPSFTDTYDLIFVDAGKRDYARYYELLLPKLPVSGILIFDNVLWGGKVVTGDNDPDTTLMRAFNEMLRNDDRVMAVMVPLRDGMTLVRKRG